MISKRPILWVILLPGISFIWCWSGEAFKSEEMMMLDSDSVYSHVACNSVKDLQE